MKRNAFGQLIPLTLANIRTIVDGDGGEGGGGDDGGKGGAGGSSYTPPATQEEFDRIIAGRVARADRAAREDERQKLAAGGKNDDKGDDKGGKNDAGLSAEDVAQQIADARAADRRELALERIADRLDKALDGRTYSASKLFALDRSQFIAEDGKSVDGAALQKWVDENTTAAVPNRRLAAQGGRDGNATAGSVQAGRDRFIEMHTKKSGKD